MPPLLLLLFSWLLLPSVWALVNVTIDDSTGDERTRKQIDYSPPDSWQSQSTCAADPTACGSLALVDPKNVDAQTWHESTFSIDPSNKHPNVPPTATATFTGTAVYVFCAIARSNNAPNGNVELTFFLDGVQRDMFVRPAAASNGFDYNVPVFALTDLSPAFPHTLTIQNGLQGGQDSLLILDRIVYSTDMAPMVAVPATSASPSATPETRKSVPGATAAVICVLVLAILILIIVLSVMLFRRRRRRRPVYAPYMPKGAVKAFPPDMEPSPASTPRMPTASSSRFVLSSEFAGGVSMPPPTYGRTRSPNWWVGRDEKRVAGIGSQRVYLDSAPGIQNPQAWEQRHPYSSSPTPSY
ncbi:hypothetical protein MKEN_00791300 [Mycena kentingensis (nom. inval.)]|nr:hypothetical protein MKEN_00791300 [Mycena kentingensis (nom. inval.)]